MSFLLLTGLGAILTLDGVTVGQFMISRPLVAGLLAGLVVGDPGLGLLVGAILETFLLVSVPSGGGRFPEPGAATVVGVAAAVWGGGPGGLALGVAAALVVGWLGAVTQSMQRQLNGRWVPDPAHEAVTPEAVVRGHGLAIGLDFGRGALLTAAGLTAVVAAAPWVAGAWPLAAAETRGALVLGAFVSLGIVARTLLGGRRWLVLAAGLVAGLLVGWGLP